MSFTLTFQAFPVPTGPLHYAYVPWDSELYGFPFYELRCENASPEILAQHLSPWLSSLPADGACLVYTKIPTRAVVVNRVLTYHGFYAVEVLLHLHLRLGRLTPVTHRQYNHTHLRLAEEADLPEVRAIACSSFSADRFHLDPNLSPDRAGQRYAQWVELGFRTGEPVFAFEDSRSAEIIGFVHSRETSISEIVDLSLGAVRKGSQGTGAGVVMFQAVLLKWLAHGYRTATTRCSINNLPMINLLFQLGFRLRVATATLHWFRAAGGGISHGR